MARPRFGQHFLVDGRWKKRILEEFNPPASFAEIGPGKGALTKLLAEEYSGFRVFEIDSGLQKFHSDQEAYEFVQMDFLDWDFSFAETKVDNFSLISNLPYESGTAIFMKVLENFRRIPHFVFMFQREVAERISASPGSKRFGALSVLSQGLYDLKYRGPISPKAFSPPPKVESGVVIGWRKADPVDFHQQYIDFVFFAFHQKRKTLRNVLKTKYSVDAYEKFLDKHSLSPGLRAEELDASFWPELYKEMNDESDR